MAYALLPLDYSPFTPSDNPLAVAQNAPAGRYTAEQRKVIRAYDNRLDTRPIM